MFVSNRVISYEKIRGQWHQLQLNGPRHFCRLVEGHNWVYGVRGDGKFPRLFEWIGIVNIVG